MRLGVLGWDDTVRMVAEAAVAAGDAIVGAAVDQDVALSNLPVRPPRCDWERLLDAADSDAILVARHGWDDTRADVLRRLVQAGRPVLVAFPPTLSMLWAFEIEMIRADTGCVIVPYLPGRLHPFIGRLRAEVESCLAGTSPFGAADAISLERPLADQSRASVLEAFAVDADLLRLLAGEPSRLATIGGRLDGAALAALTVECGGSMQIPSRWQSMRAIAGRTSARLSLVAERGSIVVEMPPVAASIGGTVPVEWTMTREGVTERLAFTPAVRMLDVLRRSVDRQGPSEAATWPDAARLVELAETIPRSISRARAIDLHQEEFSELGTFKGTMASLGCALVLAALMTLLVATLVAGLARESGWEFGERVAAAWPFLVLGTLAIFLLLQLLPFLISSQRGEESAQRRSETDQTSH